MPDTEECGPAARAPADPGGAADAQTSAREARQGLVADALVHDRHAVSDVLGELIDLGFEHRPAGVMGDLILRPRR